ncbi:Putative hypothetical protein [Helicobacter mustelae 12198]|uniref:Uncharacterized protein n=2 Tax=Helicobacter mustelae TaxID=217 RepID=D3UG79_HELM1|nr:Putative hypothetical protein [Helicobacter mustelae 12198]
MLKELLNARAELQNSSVQNVPNSAETSKTKINAQEVSPNPNQDRQTYGLLVLELMSDPEYKAFQRATAGMSEGEKIIAAQSLYSLTSFYGGKISDDQIKVKDNYGSTLGVLNRDFVERYKNAFVAQRGIDISS